MLPDGTSGRTVPDSRTREARPQHRKNRENAVASKDLKVAPTTVAFGDTAKLAPVWISGPAPKRERPGRLRRYMEAGGTVAPVDDGLAASVFDYERFTSVAGPPAQPAPGQPSPVPSPGLGVRG